MAFGDFSISNVGKEIGKSAARKVVRPGKWAMKNPKKAIGITLIVIAIVVLMATSSFGAMALMGGHAAWAPGFFSLVNVTVSSPAHIGMAMPYVMTASVGLLPLSGFAVAGAKKAIKTEKYHNWKHTYKVKGKEVTLRRYNQSQIEQLKTDTKVQAHMEHYNITFGCVVDGKVKFFLMNDGKLEGYQPDRDDSFCEDRLAEENLITDLNVLMQATVEYKVGDRSVEVKQYPYLNTQLNDLTQETLQNMNKNDLSYLLMVGEQLLVITSVQVFEQYAYKIETKKGDEIKDYMTGVDPDKIVTSVNLTC